MKPLIYIIYYNFITGGFVFQFSMCSDKLTTGVLQSLIDLLWQQLCKMLAVVAGNQLIFPADDPLNQEFDSSNWKSSDRLNLDGEQLFGASDLDHKSL